MSKSPPANTTGKLALACKCKQARQILDREQRKRDRRDLLSLVGKNSSLAVSSSSGQGTPSRNERYAARVASDVGVSNVQKSQAAVAVALSAATAIAAAITIAFAAAITAAIALASTVTITAASTDVSAAIIIVVVVIVPIKYIWQCFHASCRLI